MSTLDKWPVGTPNPPPWEVVYESDNQATDRRDVLPVAYTKGLSLFGQETKRDIPELRVYKAPPQVASALLDRIGVWIVFEQGDIKQGHYFLIGGIEYIAVLELDEHGNRYFRLAWHKDPVNKPSYSSAQVPH